LENVTKIQRVVKVKCHSWLIMVAKMLCKCIVVYKLKNPFPYHNTVGITTCASLNSIPYSLEYTPKKNKISL